MKTIRIVTVGDLELKGFASLQTGPFGTQLKASDYSNEGIPVINVRNIGFGEVRSTNLEFLSDIKAAKLHQHRLQKGDIVFGRKGAVERHALIDETTEGWLQGSDCLRLRINSPEICNEYLSYYLTTKAHQDWMQALCSFGATMSSLNQDIVRRLSFPAPEIQIQQKIAAILSSYDDLIETNKRRIALLEKMAEEIYREWFVRLRFPGHEKIKVVKGVPEGWEKQESSKTFAVLSGGTPKTDIPVYWDGEIPFFTPKDANDNFYVLNTEKSITPKGLRSCNSQLYKKDTIFITARGTVGKLALANCDMAMNQSCYALVQRSDMAVYFYFLSMKNAITYLKGVCKSGIFDNIIVDTFKIVPILVPPDNIVKHFNGLVGPFFQQMSILLQKNIILTATRDALLPRLISGKLSVENLDIMFPPGMSDV